MPAADQPPDLVEMFLYLDDVPPDLGPPRFVELHHTRDLPAMPNWYPPTAGHADPDHPSWVATDAHPDLYNSERDAAGPAGTVVAYRIGTFHRGTALTRLRGARVTLHVTYRRRDADWLGRRAWTDTANTDRWHRFVTAASPRQLGLFGFPKPGHPYWNPATRRDLEQRYPSLDTSPWA